MPALAAPPVVGGPRGNDASARLGCSDRCGKTTRTRGDDKRRRSLTVSMRTFLYRALTTSPCELHAYRQPYSPRKQPQNHHVVNRCLPIASTGFVQMNHALGQRFRAHGLGAIRTKGAVCLMAPPPDNRVFLFMILLRPENSERRKRFRIVRSFSKDRRAHERSRHDQANRERDSK